jgi:hypothetical protein
MPMVIHALVLKLHPAIDISIMAPSPAPPLPLKVTGKWIAKRS